MSNNDWQVGDYFKERANIEPFKITHVGPNTIVATTKSLSGYRDFIFAIDKINNPPYFKCDANGNPISKHTITPQTIINVAMSELNKQEQYDKWKQIEAEGPKVGQWWVSTDYTTVFEILSCDKYVRVKYIAVKESCMSHMVNKEYNLEPPDQFKAVYELFKDVPTYGEVKDYIDFNEVHSFIRTKDIVNAIHNPDHPTTEDEINRAWDVTKMLCRGG